MSDPSQNSQRTIVPVTEDLTSLMNVTAAGGRLFTELVNATASREPAYVPANYKGAPQKNPGINPVHQANTVEEMAILLTPLISEQFALSNSVANKLRTQLGLYIKDTVIMNESCLGMMTESSSWVVQDSFATSG